MWNDVAKSSVAIVAPKVEGIAIGNDVGTVGDEEDRFEPDALLTNVALSVALLRGVPNIAQTLDVLLLESRLVVQRAETAPASGRVRRVIFKEDEL